MYVCMYMRMLCIKLYKINGSLCACESKYVHLLKECCGNILNPTFQVKGKELVSRHDIIPSSTTRWIRLLHPELHEEHADELEFVSTRAVVFTPPARCRFELLRFHTSFAERSLPFTLRTVASVKGAEVTVQSWLLMAQGFVPNRDALTIIPCENVMVRLQPVSLFTYLFIYYFGRQLLRK